MDTSPLIITCAALIAFFSHVPADPTRRLRRWDVLLLFCTHVGWIALCGGALGRPYIAVTAILAWGMGARQQSRRC